MAASIHVAWVYIITNDAKTVLYCGFSTALYARLWEHRTKQNPNCFTAKYNIYRLVYYKGYETIGSAEAVEKQIKGKSRAWKVRLINSFNPEWKDLTEEVKNL